MAVKERKQITGTTAQINAYKGHEGQIVWDKDKKTFVGMSGTAGKNYPLAPQAYVDNEIKKVNAEVAKKQPKGNYATTAQLTEGLAGKEDKGVCLPLTGGVMVGDIKSDPNNPELFIGHAYNERLGAFISLRSINREEPEMKGSFALSAITSEQEMWLIGKPDGDLVWGIEKVLTISEGGSSWLRYSNGLQICWGTAKIGASYINATVTLPMPFAHEGYFAGTSSIGTDSAPTVSTATGAKTTTTFVIAAATPEYSWDRWIDWVAIGMWK